MVPGGIHRAGRLSGGGLGGDQGREGEPRNRTDYIIDGLSAKWKSGVPYVKNDEESQESNDRALNKHGAWCDKLAPPGHVGPGHGIALCRSQLCSI